MRHYRAVKDEPETGQNEVEFDHRRIAHHAYSDSSKDTLAWGYRGAGTTNTARSILEHAVKEADTPISVSPAEAQQDFRDEFLLNVDSDEEWTIAFEDVVEFLTNYDD